MSCKDCEEAEKNGIAYYRWDTANIGMIGCPKHLKEIFEVLNKAQHDKVIKGDSTE